MADLGTDLAGVFDLDWALSTVSGRTALAQAILRRLTTPRGGLLGEPSYGYALQQLVGSTVPTGVVETRVAEQVLLEEEVLEAAVDAEFSGDAITVSISAVDGEGPFDLTITSSAELTLEAFLDGVLFLQQAA